MTKYRLEKDIKKALKESDYVYIEHKTYSFMFRFDEEHDVNGIVIFIAEYYIIIEDYGFIGYMRDNNYEVFNEDLLSYCSDYANYFNMMANALVKAKKIKLTK